VPVWQSTSEAQSSFGALSPVSYRNYSQIWHYVLVAAREPDGDAFMSKEDDYRRHAADTLDLAQRATATSDKTRLLHMAEAWLDLADRAHKVAQRQVQKVRELHPLLCAKILGHGSEAE